MMSDTPDFTPRPALIPRRRAALVDATVLRMEAITPGAPRVRRCAKHGALNLVLFQSQPRADDEKTGRRQTTRHARTDATTIAAQTCGASVHQHDPRDIGRRLMFTGEPSRDCAARSCGASLIEGCANGFECLDGECEAGEVPKLKRLVW